MVPSACLLLKAAVLTGITSVPGAHHIPFSLLVSGNPPSAHKCAWDADGPELSSPLLCSSWCQKWHRKGCVLAYQMWGESYLFPLWALSAGPQASWKKKDGKNRRKAALDSSLADWYQESASISMSLASMSNSITFSEHSKVLSGHTQCHRYLFHVS